MKIATRFALCLTLLAAPALAVEIDALPSTKSIGWTSPLMSYDAGTGEIRFRWSGTTRVAFTSSGGVVATTLTGALTGNATTATALASNPADCSSGQYASAIAATGALSCAQVNYSQLAGTVPNAPTATALAANGTNCSAGDAAGGVDASGNAEDCFTPEGGGGPASPPASTASCASPAYQFSDIADMGVDARPIDGDLVLCAGGQEVLAANDGGSVVLPGSLIVDGSAIVSQGLTVADGYPLIINGGSLALNYYDEGAAANVEVLPLSRSIDADFSGTPLVGFGGEITLHLQKPASGTGNNATAGGIGFEWSELTANAEDADLVVHCMRAGSVTEPQPECFRVSSVGVATASGFSGPLTGNATTATALASNPADCSAGEYASSIGASGALSCSQVNYGQLGGTVPNAPTATALAANGSNCSAGQAARGVDASGAAESCFAPGDVVGPSSSVDNACARYDSTTGKLLQATSDCLVQDDGTILNGRDVVSVTSGVGAPRVLTAAETGTHWNNIGATAEVYFTLPTAAAQLTFRFCNVDSDDMRVTAASGDVIWAGGTATATAGFVRTIVPGSCLDVVAQDATNWMGMISGTWTVDL